MDLFGNLKDIYSNGTASLKPILRNITSKWMFGTTTLQALLGNSPTLNTYSSTKPTDSLGSFIEWERPIALQKIMCHIGSLCLDELSIGPGILIASPSKNDPDCELRPSITPRATGHR